MSKRVPVYMSEEELKTLLEWKQGADDNNAYWTAEYLSGKHEKLEQRLKEILATFEE